MTFVFPKLGSALKGFHFESVVEQCVYNVVRRILESYANSSFPFASCSAKGDIWFMYQMF